MRRRLAVLTLVFAFIALPSVAMATLITNKDNKDHTIKLSQGSGSVSATVKANRSVSFRCPSYPCSIKLGDSTVKVRSSKDDVLIQNGKLVVKTRVASRDK